MINDSLAYFVGFSHTPSIGYQSVKKLVTYFGSVKNAYEASENRLTRILGEKRAHIFVTFRETFQPHSMVNRLFKESVHIIVPDSPGHPSTNGAIYRPPLCLYAKGDVSLLTNLSKNLAIVGTRKPSQYGIRMARQFSFDLTRCGYTIVSGMAYGIDSEAHMACMSAGGKTIAILGCGICALDSGDRRAFVEKIIENGGLVVSEFPPFSSAKPQNFPIRNRLVSGMSTATLIIEGTRTSGSCITARLAAEQGRDVFCVPGNLDNPNAEGPNNLIKNGAHLVTCAEDILTMLQ